MEEKVMERNRYGQVKAFNLRKTVIIVRNYRLAKV